MDFAKLRKPERRLGRPRAGNSQNLSAEQRSIRKKELLKIERNRQRTLREMVDTALDHGICVIKGALCGACEGHDAFSCVTSVTQTTSSSGWEKILQQKQLRVSDWQELPVGCDGIKKRLFEVEQIVSDAIRQRDSDLSCNERLLMQKVSRKPQQLHRDSVAPKEILSANLEHIGSAD